MRTFLVLLLLFSIFCNPTENDNKNKLEKGKKRKQFNADFSECILKNGTASEELKKNVEENKDGQLRKVLFELKDKLNESDLNLINHCKKEAFIKLRETIQKTFQEISSKIIK